MRFSTKGRYGLRGMFELARGFGEPRPCSEPGGKKKHGSRGRRGLPAKPAGTLWRPAHRVQRIRPVWAIRKAPTDMNISVSQARNGLYAVKIN